jgi:hypothetical protein
VSETCPTCGSDVDCPRDRADAQGFDPKLHCGMLANQKGRVIPCWSLRELGVARLCDTQHPMCPVFKHFVVERPVGIGGRMLNVMKGGRYDKHK